MTLEWKMCRGTPQCSAADEGGYRCELARDHVGPHRAIINAADEEGAIPERTWITAPVPAAPAPAPSETCGKCGRPKGHPLHDADRQPGRISTNHPHHAFVPRDAMTLDDLGGYRPPAAPAPEADDTPTWLLEQQRKDDHETVVLGIIAAPEWLDADGVRGMLIDLLGECDDATLGRMAALCITRYAPPSPTAEPDPDEASREYPF